MRSILKEKLFRKHYNKLLHSRRDKTHKDSINTISSITILAAAKNHSVDSIKKAPAFFRKMDLQCDVYVVKDPSDQIDISANLNLISSKDCMWYGVPSQEILIEWLANKTDLLILANPDREPLMKYLCAASNSKLKSTLTYRDQQNDDIDIDLWIDIANANNVTLEEQCRLTYMMLTNLGLRPPVIG